MKLNNKDIKITSGDLARFRYMYVGTSELADRMSELIWLDINILDTEFGVGTHNILSPIKDLEQGEPPTGIKPATQFENMPLKGLWHKHYFSAHSLADNIILGLGKNGIKKLIKESMDPEKSPIITEEMINEIAHRVTHEPVETREAHKKLTGEWIIYLRHEGKNYYLCCCTHDDGDQFIYDRIMENCVRDFPDLPAWLEAEQTS